MRLIHSGPAERTSYEFRCPLTGVYHISFTGVFQPCKPSLFPSIGKFRALDILVGRVYYLFLSTTNGLPISHSPQKGDG